MDFWFKGLFKMNVNNFDYQQSLKTLLKKNANKSSIK